MTFRASGIARKFLAARGLALRPPAGFGKVIVSGKLRAEKHRCEREEKKNENHRKRAREKSLVGRRYDKPSPSLLFLETVRIVRTKCRFQPW